MSFDQGDQVEQGPLTRAATAGQVSKDAAVGAPKGEITRRKLRPRELLPARRTLPKRRSPLQHRPPRFSMVLSVETRNVLCAANHYLVKEPFLSAAGSRLSTPKVAETFRFRCSGLLGCDASRRISFGWNSSQPPEIPLGICITSGLFSAAFETSDLRTDIV